MPMFKFCSQLKLVNPSSTLGDSQTIIDLVEEVFTGCEDISPDSDEDEDEDEEDEDDGEEEVEDEEDVVDEVDEDEDVGRVEVGRASSASFMLLLSALFIGLVGGDTQDILTPFFSSIIYTLNNHNRNLPAQTRVS